jgi:8-oxo-dGTP pyrophosphatase MutT (NUDIX family)
MRHSEGSLAYIARRRQGQVELLTQWSDSWRAFHLVGGHRHLGENFHECVVREVMEELGLHVGVDFQAADQPLAHLEFIGWSESARVETAYTLEIFRVELLGEAVEQQVATCPQNRWLTQGELRAAVCTDGKRVSPSLSRILEMLARSPTTLPRSN